MFALDARDGHVSSLAFTPDATGLYATHGYRGVHAWDLADRTSRPVVIGTGPCGVFAGLILAQMGFRPILLERGKVVRERTKDTWGLWRRRELNPESNVQFGEGGAGSFSDGKLYSQIKDPHHYGRKVLTEFVKAGYTIAQIATVLLIIAFVLTNIDPFYESLFLFGAVTFLLLYILLLIEDLDNPFSYDHPFSGSRVSRKLMRDTLARLDRDIEAMQAAAGGAREHLVASQQ